MTLTKTSLDNSLAIVGWAIIATVVTIAIGIVQLATALTAALDALVERSLATPPSMAIAGFIPLALLPAAAEPEPALEPLEELFNAPVLAKYADPTPTRKPTLKALRAEAKRQGVAKYSRLTREELDALGICA